MTKKNEVYLLVICLLVSSTGVIVRYGFQVELKAVQEYVLQTITYLTGLATLFLLGVGSTIKFHQKEKNR